MTMTAGRAFLLWVLAMLVGLGVVWNSRFTADMSFFMPAHPTAEQQVLVDQLREGVVSRLLMIAILGGNALQRAELSRELRLRLAANRAYFTVQNGESSNLAADRDFLFRHRYLLSPTVTPGRFTEGGLRQAIDESLQLIASPLGMMLKSLLPHDPTGEMLSILRALDANAEPDSQEGVWASHDGERAILLVQTRALGSDTDGQESAIAGINAAFAESRLALGFSALDMVVSGPGLFAVHSRATIKEDVTRLSAISTMAIVLLLWLVYRSPRLLALSLLPVASGALAGIVAVSLCFGTIFGITVGFGTALIGEAVDYSIYFVVQSRSGGLADWRRRFWPTVRLGVLTSVFGFGVLVFSDFPGLAQLGLYALTGVIVAAAVTYYVLPFLSESTPRLRDLAPTGRHLVRLVRRASALRWPSFMLALAALMMLLQQHDKLWNYDLSALSTISKAELDRDMALRNDLGAPDSRYLVVARGTDRESALQAAEHVGLLLDALVKEGALSAYETPVRFLPSKRTQEARLASLPVTAELKQALTAALAGSPLKANKLGGFLDDVATARRQPLIDRSALDGTSLALAVDSLLIGHDNNWSVVLPLRPSERDIEPAQIRAALASSGALFIDMKAEVNRLYDSYLREAITLALGGVLAIAVLLVFTLGSARRVGVVLLPLGLSILFVIAGLHLLGERLHLLHLVGLLLIVAVGSNYALFFEKAGHDGRLEPATMTSMLLANLTTAFGFGTLTLSKVPVLHALGATVGPGTIFALLLSAAFLPRETHE